MRRRQVPQFTEQSWFPNFLRRDIHEFMAWFVGRVGAAKPFVPLVEEALGSAPERQLLAVDVGQGAGVETVLPLLSEVTAVRLGVGDSFLDQRGVCTLINGLHLLPPEVARSTLETLASSGNPVLVLEGNNDNWWQAIGMLVFVPLTALLTAPFVRPFRWSRLVFTYLIPILPLVTSLDGVAALFKLYGPPDLEELVAPIASDRYRWEAGKADNGRGGKIIYLSGVPRSSEHPRR